MSEYVHGYESDEQARLVAQAEHWRAELILDATSLAQGTRLLEVGCGVGAVLGILGSAFPGISLAGVDVEERQVASARRHLAALGLRADLRVADALALPFPDGAFDHVWMMWFLEHLADPVGALREARRVLAPGGRLTAIEVDYNTVWSSPQDDAFDAVFAEIARTMETGGRSDAGSQLGGWLAAAGFAEVDPGERRLRYEGDALARQAPYVAEVIESTLRPGTPGLEAGLKHLRALPRTAGAAIGWVVHKAHAAR
jgi:ubiquinone/menaquinone biosynthesis C-methylase UbiE